MTIQYTFRKKIVPSYMTVAVAILDEVTQPEMFICTHFFLQGISHETQLVLGLLIAYKMYTGLVFSSIVFDGIE